VGKTTEKAKKAERKLKRMDMGKDKAESMRKEGACLVRRNVITTEMTTA
jgi:hypothetical protein